MSEQHHPGDYATVYGLQGMIQAGAVKANTMAAINAEDDRAGRPQTYGLYEIMDVADSMFAFAQKLIDFSHC
jgi:hypothetical protein